jgi:hypothetical protein
MVFQNRRLNKKRRTIDPSQEIRIEIEFLESVDGFQPQSFLNLNSFLGLLHIIIKMRKVDKYRGEYSI